ncbi:MAG TPA: TonB-dependent receptor [Bacteroidales bacterium]|nr:TonB-dependent receptor [Bacteroidales bacterium]
MKKLLLLFFVFCGFLLQVSAQQKTVTGTVTGADDNQPVIGATVQIKGTSTGVATDVNGNFSISAAEGTILEIRYVGMKTKEVIVGKASIYNIALELESVGLNEVVVVGYGTQVKSKLTASLTKVEGEGLKNIPVPSVDQTLQGKSAGVFIESTTGKVSGATRMRIRGSTSINADNQPLFIVDGIPITNIPLNESGAAINPLTSISANDIESMVVLKDAASAAMYGSRGANGVVIITTKKGISGATKINATVQTGVSTPSHLRDFMNSSQYISYFREAAANSDVIDGYAQSDPDSWTTFVNQRLKRYSGWAAQLDGSGNFVGTSANTDWQKAAFQTGKVYSADISAQGGTDKLRYYASGSYNSTGGILVSNSIEKISGRISVDDKINKVLEMGMGLNLNRTFIKQVSADNAFSTPMQLVALSPISPLRTQDGTRYSDTPVTTYYDPLIDVTDAFRRITEYRVVSNGYLNFNIIKGLKLRNEIGIDVYNLKENARYGEYTDSGNGIGGYAFANYAQTQNLTARSFLDLNRSFNQINVSAVLGTEMQRTTVEKVFGEGHQFPMDELKTLASAGVTDATATLTQYGFLSYFTRASLDYSSKYLLSLSARIDGSSRFGKDTRYGFFPAASLGWVISKENFLAENPTLSYLKFRVSYGETGNAGISDFGSLGLYGVAGYNYMKGLIPTQPPNPNLGWESTSQYDAGLDYGFFNNRLTGEIDVYMKKTHNLLLQVPVPTTTGYDSQWQNIGEVQNKGFEFTLNSNNLTGVFGWNTSLNFSYNKNEVTSLGGQSIIDNGGARYMNVVLVGQPIGVFYGAQYAGVDPANGDALWYVNEKDASGHIINPKATTNNFNDANFVVLGDPTPKYIGAITNTFDFKGVELSFSLQGVAGNKVHLVGDQWMGANGVWFDNQLTSQLAAWKSAGDITDVPQARLGYDNGDQSRNGRYVCDGSYLKLRTLVLSYDFPKFITQKMKLDKLRVFAQCQNLLTFTRYKGWDPEVSSDFMNGNIYSGIDFYSAPQPRTIMFGINIGL